MRKVVSLFLFILLTASFLFASSLLGFALTVDPAHDASLTVQYKHNGEYFEGIEVRSYRIAEFFSDGSYNLTGDFSGYPVNIHNIKSQSEWKEVASTLEAYVESDNIEPTCKANTNELGIVYFNNILPGIYLTHSVKVEGDGEVTEFYNFLTFVPQPENNVNNYHVTVYPKCTSYTPTPEEVEYKVVKQWKDNGDVNKRPSAIEVDILKNGEIYLSAELSSENNWSFEFTVADDGSSYNVIERDVPDGYTVTYVNNGSVFTITNQCIDNDDDPPQTGETMILYPYILAMCLSGGILLVLSVWSKRRLS